MTTPAAPPDVGASSSQRSTRALLFTVVLFAVVVGVIFGGSRLANRGATSQGGQQSATNTSQGVLLGATPAPAFTLTDQNGATVTLDSLKGRPTVFTFFDSVCPHADCPLIAHYLNLTAQDMGSDAGKVNWVALSLNPWHDTPQTVAAFISNQRLSLHLTYLLGSASQLQPLWDAFHMQSVEQADGVVIHTTGIYVLDSQARELVYMDEGFDPRALSADMRLVLTKGDSAFAGQPVVSTSNAITEVHTVDGMQVTLTSAPGQYGAFDYTVMLQNQQGGAISNAQVALDLSMPDMKMQPVHEDLQPVTPATTGAYRVTGVLSMKGRWVVNVTITPPGAANPSVTTFSFDANY
ncbi:MAG TPA: SCO family protein [Ktedonobacterales bacterium]